MYSFEHHIGDYDEATAHISMVQDGCYSRLIRKYYAKEGPLPADVNVVQRLVRAFTDEDKAAVVAMLEEFFVLKDDGWHNVRCDKEIRDYKKLCKNNRKIAQEREARRRTERARTVHDSSDSGEPNHPPINRPPSTHLPSTSTQPLPGEGALAGLAMGVGHGRAGNLPTPEALRQFVDALDPEAAKLMPGAAVQKACLFLGMHPATAGRAICRNDLSLDQLQREYAEVFSDKTRTTPLGTLARRLRLAKGKAKS